MYFGCGNCRALTSILSSIRFASETDVRDYVVRKEQH